MVSKKRIVEGLDELGLRAGDAVIVHSSLSSFGRVEGGAETVVDALLEVLTARGTLVVPTFSWSVYDGDPFDPQQTPSSVGKVTEAVRERPDAIRSLHPTHSVAAIGRLAEVITKGHEKVHATGRGSPFFKLLQANGKVLLLGTDQTSNSMIHLAEELAGVPYVGRSEEVGVRTARGKVVRKRIYGPGCSRGFATVDPVLREEGAIIEKLIGECRARLMNARAVVDAAVNALKFDASALLCERPNCVRCAEARAIILATEMDRQDQEVVDLAKDEERTLRIIERQLDGGEVRYFETEENGSSPN